MENVSYTRGRYKCEDNEAFRKISETNNKGTVYYRLNLPKEWLELLGLLKDKQVKLIKEETRIIIEKQI